VVPVDLINGVCKLQQGENRTGTSSLKGKVLFSIRRIPEKLKANLQSWSYF
jgi:hypothetical protein